MAALDRLSYPVIVEVPENGNHLPDFILKLGQHETLGVEVTEAGEATWQKWLTHSESADTRKTVQLYPSKGGYAGDEPGRIVVHDVLEAIRRKSAKHAQGAYQDSPATDLLIYENSEGGLMVNKHEAVESIRRTLLERQESLVFRQVHLIFGDEVSVDLAGSSFEQVDISKSHADDWSNWLEDQARLLRQRNFNAVDADNLAEELDSLARSDQRAMKSQILRLLIHLLKWTSQPRKRGKSWKSSISLARDEIEAILGENPSFENRYLAAVQQEHPRARRAAAQQMSIELDELPAECPFSVDELRDPDFFPEGFE